MAMGADASAKMLSFFSSLPVALQSFWPSLHPLDLLVSLLRRSSNNLNQLTRRVHEIGRIYDADLEDITQRQEQLWEGVREILSQLSKLS